MNNFPQKRDLSSKFDGFDAFLPKNKKYNPGEDSGSNFKKVQGRSSRNYLTSYSNPNL